MAICLGLCCLPWALLRLKSRAMLVAFAPWVALGGSARPGVEQRPADANTGSFSGTGTFGIDCKARARSSGEPRHSSYFAPGG